MFERRIYACALRVRGRSLSVGDLRQFVALTAWVALLLIGRCAWAQLPDTTSGQRPTPETGNETPLTLFPHFAEGRFWLSGQNNVIFQVNPSFDAKYTGQNSFKPTSQNATGQVTTIYTGMQLWKSGEVLVDFEAAGGLGLSGALGIGGFTNLDAVRDPTLTDVPYLARVMYHHVIPLGHDKGEGNRGPLSTFSELPSRRLELRVGKFAVTDFFDTNAVGGDSHLQFMNWSVDQNGAYDFTGDARGYTWGVAAEYQSPRWGLRFAEALMPGPQNGGPLVWNLHKANTSNTEFEVHRGILRKKAGIVRVLGYLNHANMGTYDYAIDQYLAGNTPQPDIDDHPFKVTSKYGFGINGEQSLSDFITLYARWGWNNGKTESWCFTEIDNTISGGAGFLGHLWKRNNDRAGIAFVSNGISSEHQRYLADGGLGFVLGDGGLKYRRENLVEFHYTAHIWRGFYTGPDLQYVVDPGYNQVRGPIFVASFRLHTEL
jgi:high affinity Mn2+ porin